MAESTEETAHLKPICHDSTSVQDHLVKKWKKQPKNNSFQDHQPSKAKSVFPEGNQLYGHQIHVV